MADPLRLIGGGSGGLGAGGVTGPRGPLGAGALGATGANGGQSFADTLMGKIEEVNKLQGEAARATEDFASGQRGDFENVILATQKADLAYRMLLSLRNKLQAAIDETKQVRI